MLSCQQLRRVLEVRPHIFRDLTETDRGEVIDGEPGILRVVHREHSGKCRSEIGNLESLDKLAHTHLLHHLLHENLDEDAR
jgi:hypothetical protein